MANILVTGGTGILGREVVHRLLARKHSPRVLSRHGQTTFPSGTEVVTGDLISGTGLSEAVTGIDTIIHCASSPAEAQATDVGGTRHLIQAASEAGSPHLIYISLVGADQASAYGQAKLQAEAIVKQASLPWSIIRSTPFHPFVLRLIQSLGVETLSVIPAPAGVRLQPIDVGDIADHLITLLDKGPTREIQEIAGPRTHTLEELIELYLHQGERKKALRSIDLPDSLFAALRETSHLSTSETRGSTTWQDFLHTWNHNRESHSPQRGLLEIHMQQRIQNHSPTQISVLTVTLEPGAQGAPPHRHPGPVFGYVLEGALLFEMRGHAPIVYQQGDVFYEPNGCLHLLANNAYPAQRTRFLAVLIGEPDQPILTPVPLRADANEPVESEGEKHHEHACHHEEKE